MPASRSNPAAAAPNEQCQCDENGADDKEYGESHDASGHRALLWTPAIIDRLVPDKGADHEGRPVDAVSGGQIRPEVPPSTTRLIHGRRNRLREVLLDQAVGAVHSFGGLVAGAG